MCRAPARALALLATAALTTPGAQAQGGGDILQEIVEYKPAVLREGRYVDFSEFPAGSLPSDAYYAFGLDFVGGDIALRDDGTHWYQAVPGYPLVSVLSRDLEGDPSGVARVSLQLVGSASMRFRVTAYEVGGATVAQRQDARAGERVAFADPRVVRVDVTPVGSATAPWGIDELLVEADEAVLDAEARLPTDLGLCVTIGGQPNPDVVLSVDAPPVGTMARLSGADGCVSVPLADAATPGAVQEFGYIAGNGQQMISCYTLGGAALPGFGLQVSAVLLFAPYFVNEYVETGATGCYDFPAAQAAGVYNARGVLPADTAE